jgi:preprotein translocase subunit SecD
MTPVPLWKSALLILVVGFGVVFALPNLYAPDPSIQITGNSRAAEVEEGLHIASDALTAAGIEHFGAELTSEGVALIRLRDGNQQHAAQKVVHEALDTSAFRAQEKRYVVALHRASNTPDWLLSIGAKPMNLGLDLAGGVHFVLEVDTSKAVVDHLDDAQELLKESIREKRLSNVDIELDQRAIVLRAMNEGTQAALIELLQENLPDLVRQNGSESDDSYWVRAELSDRSSREIEDHAVSQNLTTLRNRVNELGVSEPLVQRQGRNRIVVELPGVQDAAGAKKILGKTANLEFRLEADPSEPVAPDDQFEFYTEKDRQMRGPQSLERRRIISGDRVMNAVAGFDDQTNTPKIDITLDSEGGHLMHHATRNQIGRNMGVLFIDYYTEKQHIVENDVVVEKDVAKVDKKIINLATIRSALGVRFQITGLDNVREANDIALLLRAGSLAAPMLFVDERTIGPSLGAKNIARGLKSVQIGLLLVVIFMLAYYKVFGLVANLALGIDMVLLIALMSTLGATLTMPGIAGIVLTMGMVVDANVLIYSRIKEELKAGLSPKDAIHAGFDRAFITILDTNLSMLIVGVILFAIGSGPIRGFAVTLSLGILTAVFTAVLGTRVMVNLIYGNRNVARLWI